MSDPEVSPDPTVDRGATAGNASARDLESLVTDLHPVEAEETLELLERFRQASSPADWQRIRHSASPTLDLSSSVAESGGHPQAIGRFRILEEIGRGGSAVVFRAFDPQRRADVALKVPLLATLVQHDLRERFLREAATTAGFEHPNLLPIYEVGNDGLLWYMVSELCHGPDLATWLKQQPAAIPVRAIASNHAGIPVRIA